MINKNCNCENKVSSRKLVVPNSIFSKSSSCKKTITALEKGSEKVASSKSSSSTVLCVAS